jgi:APA family basic amino acid/polyamine antiporter
VIAHTAVLLVFQLGQARIFFSISRDGMLPGVFSRVHPKFRTPHINTIIIGLLVGVTAAFTTIDEMVDLTNIGTLFAFILVCIGIPVLRYREPHRERPFRVPLGPWFFPILGVSSCLFLMVYLPPASWWRFVGWLALGLSIYSAYGYTRSVLSKGERRSGLSGKLLGAGFLLIAVGLFTIPHNAGPVLLFETAATSGMPGHGGALGGLLLMGTGAVLCVMGRVTAQSRSVVSEAER